MAEPADIAQVRAFNRFYTRIIGLLEEGMHQTLHTLSEARVIYELDKAGTTTSAMVAETLGMDRAQLSRLIGKLVSQDIVAVLPRAGDRRSVPLALTREGREVAKHFNAMSDATAAETLLDPLTAFEQRDLVGSMRRISALLAEPEETTLVLRSSRVGEIGWLIHRQAVLYHLEQGWNGEFETLITRIYADFEAAPSTPAKQLWVAEIEGEVAGSVFVLPAEDGEEGTAQLRMLYVEPMFRGRGVGGRLVTEAVSFAKMSGYKRIMLWTQDCLASARSIYQKAGFVLAKEERHHSFGADLNGQYWVLEL
ncbi:bifunctional helix-turn-helix transcriptional regulator/GNAT family N-acetyltransferase [Devosia sp.]|uniref:bifunctional helix-turn-helix transcriptional regulator/GNAT family N-acetyltransferase n=1 Tax=Devosia sp. TaxID=1871048 RepID=UPI002600F367|nr:bifunctional helix-turn-helix transcriptional regulator/GNAT family N-acetyltransferase [Devosia sp.]MCR6637330.1 bifunctional helix-turn-helix transcriptional regulator/GNAT family N-acetyltransferase [Devosia sp.]